MTLDEKIGQMTQANKNALTATSDIATYYLGSLQTLSEIRICHSLRGFLR